jgi:hypothetical protein
MFASGRLCSKADLTVSASGRLGYGSLPSLRSIRIIAIA